MGYKKKDVMKKNKRANGVSLLDLEPEKRLAVEMIRLAMKDADNEIYGKGEWKSNYTKEMANRNKIKEKETAIEWLKNSKKGIITFGWCCEILDLSEWGIRRKVFE